MLWLLRKIVDRLLVKSVVIIGSELESQMEMEISEARAELLRRARKLEQEEIAGLSEVAAALRARAMRLGNEAEAPCSDVLHAVAALEHENLRDAGSLQYAIEKEKEERETDGQVRPLFPSPTGGAAGAARKRGRPRKELSAE